MAYFKIGIQNPYLKAYRMDQYSERRRESRLYYWMPIAIEKLGDSFIYRARLANYSKSGLYFEADLLLHPEAKVYIRIQDSPHSFFPEDHGFFWVKVVWWKPLTERGFNYGYGAKVISNEIGKKSQKSNNYKTKELRKAPRKSFSKPTYFTFENKYYKGAIKNISRSGAFIESKAKLLNGGELKLVVPGTKKYFLLKGEIRHFNLTGFGVDFKRVLKIQKIV